MALIINLTKSMNTNNQSKKSVSFMAEVAQGVREIVSKAETREGVITALEQYLGMKIRESFKNGIEVGRKQSLGKKSGYTGQRERQYQRQ